MTGASYAVLMSIIKAILWIYFMIYMYLIGMLIVFLSVDILTCL